MKLVYRHGHPDNKKRISEIQRALDNLLDHDQSAELIEMATDELSFVHSARGEIWYEQNRACLEFIEEECEVELWEVSKLFSHLTPPSLRDEFGLP